jgi:hypothetical protein
VGEVVVDYAFVAGTAQPPGDFTGINGSVTWADGDIANKTIMIPITDDSTPEAVETFGVTLSNPSTAGLTLAAANAEVTITANDDVGDVAVFDFVIVAATLSEGGSLVLGVTRNGPASGAVSVDFATSSSTATAGSDFTSVSGTLDWADGDLSTKSITVFTIDDTTDEGDETLTVRLLNPSTGAILGSNATVTVTIVDDDPSEGGGGDQVVDLITIAATLSEGGSVALRVARTGPASGAASVDFATSSGSATAGSDYMSASGTLHWADGDSSDKTITVNIIDDTTDEGDETLAVTLSNASGAALGSNSTASVTITDNDPPAVDPPPVVGNGGGGGGGGAFDWLAVLVLTCFGLGSRLRQHLAQPTRSLTARHAWSIAAWV